LSKKLAEKAASSVSSKANNSINISVEKKGQNTQNLHSGLQKMFPKNGRESISTKSRNLAKEMILKSFQKKGQGTFFSKRSIEENTETQMSERSGEKR
jgi:hypothetical protein